MFASMLGLFITGFLIFLIGFGMIGAIISSASQEKKVTLKENSVIYMNLQEEITDRTSENPFDHFDFNNFESAPQLGLNDILRSIEQAGEDDRVQGIFMELDFVMIGYAAIDEIRDALLEFRSKGKFVYCYGEVFSQKAYYLASAADEVHLNPSGMLDFRGISSQRLFFKRALEKLEIEPQVIRHGKFKSAVEPFIREDMSEANRAQTQQFIGTMWDHLVQGISASRAVSSDELNRLASTLSVTLPEKALNASMIDRISFRDEVIDMIKMEMEVEEDDDLEMIKLRKYARVDLEKGEEDVDSELERKKNQIAVVYASGDIVSGKSGDNTMGSKTIAKAIKSARENEKVKAIVLRINSPGGSALASDVIWREVMLTKGTKPVIVSMGDLAASGGYYIACGADTIVAGENTITGSIGVFGVIPNMQGLFENKLGITSDTVNTNKYADMGSGVRPLSDHETVVITEMIEKIYDDFISKVAEGRGMSKEDVDEIGQGRVWSGTDALRLGLVDELGGLDRAIELAAESAHLENYSIKELPKQDSFELIFGNFADNMEVNVLKSALGDRYKDYLNIEKAINRRGIFVRLPYDILLD